VEIVGAYDFDAPPPWRSLSWLTRPVELSAIDERLELSLLASP
jgi:hypothetical protein